MNKVKKVFLSFMILIFVITGGICTAKAADQITPEKLQQLLTMFGYL